jgi:hypothetical protein
LGKSGGPVAQVDQDGAALAQAGAVVQLQNRDLTERVLGEKGGRPRLALEEVDLLILERRAEPAQGQPDLVAIARGEKVVEAHRAMVLGRRHAVAT